MSSRHRLLRRHGWRSAVVALCLDLFARCVGANDSSTGSGACVAVAPWRGQGGPAPMFVGPSQAASGHLSSQRHQAQCERRYGVRDLGCLVSARLVGAAPEGFSPNAAGQGEPCGANLGRCIAICGGAAVLGSPAPALSGNDGATPWHAVPEKGSVRMMCQCFLFSLRRRSSHQVWLCQLMCVHRLLVACVLNGLSSLAFSCLSCQPPRGARAYAGACLLLPCCILRVPVSLL